MDSNYSSAELDYLLQFLPMNYIRNIVIPSTNHYVETKNHQWESLNLDKFLHFLEMLLFMEVFEIHGPHNMYWREERSNLFPPMNFGKIMSRNRFEEIARFLQLLFNQDHDQQILKFLEAVNSQFQACLTT